MSTGRKLVQFCRDEYPDAAGEGQPRLYMNLIEGGVHAGSDLAFQEYLVIPEVNTVPDAVDVGTRFYNELKAYFRDIDPRALNLGFEGGLTPDLADDDAPLQVFDAIREKLGDTNVGYGIDVAGSNVDRPSAALTETYRTLCDRYPLAYIEDPYHEEDIESHAALTDELGDRIAITGDDLTVTNTARMADVHEAGGVNAVIIKPNQIGTFTEAFDAITRAREYGWRAICSHRGSETTDDWIADIAVAVGADGIKLGAPARGERVAKYNRLLAISTE
jgi:enolase